MLYYLIYFKESGSFLLIGTLKIIKILMWKSNTEERENIQKRKIFGLDLRDWRFMTF